MRPSNLASQHAHNTRNIFSRPAQDLPRRTGSPSTPGSAKWWWNHGELPLRCCSHSEIQIQTPPTQSNAAFWNLSQILNFIKQEIANLWWFWPLPSGFLWCLLFRLMSEIRKNSWPPAVNYIFERFIYWELWGKISTLDIISDCFYPISHKYISNQRMVGKKHGKIASIYRNSHFTMKIKC